MTHMYIFDIICLLSGSRRFVVTSVDPNSQQQLRLASCGVVFYLEELQEVSEKTQDQIKYASRLTAAL